MSSYLFLSFQSFVALLIFIHLCYLGIWAKIRILNPSLWVLTNWILHLPSFFILTFALHPSFIFMYITVVGNTLKVISFGGTNRQIVRQIKYPPKLYTSKTLYLQNFIPPKPFPTKTFYHQRFLFSRGLPLTENIPVLQTAKSSAKTDILQNFRLPNLLSAKTLSRQTFNPPKP